MNEKQKISYDDKILYLNMLLRQKLLTKGKVSVLCDMNRSIVYRITNLKNIHAFNDRLIRVFGQHYKIGAPNLRTVDEKIVFINVEMGRLGINKRILFKAMEDYDGRINPEKYLMMNLHKMHQTANIMIDRIEQYYGKYVI